jgi:hypothetical protein
MSDINLDFTVSNNSIQFTVEPNEITITPTDIQLTLGSTGGTVPAGNVGQLQYKVSGLQFGGVPNTLYDGSNLSLGDVSNVKIGGGTNGYVLQTDGSGNLEWTAMSGGGGNGSPGGSNTQIQYNDSGTFGGNAGFTFNEVSGNVAIPGSLVVSGNISGVQLTGTLTTAAQPNISNVGTLTSLTVAGTTSIQQAQEKVTLDGVGTTGTVNFDLLTQAILYKTANSTSNFTLNIRGNSSVSLNSIMSNGQSFTCTLLDTLGVLGSYCDNVSVDSSIVPVKWAGGAPTTGTPNAINSYTFNIIKTGSGVFTVLGSLTGFQ